MNKMQDFLIRAGNELGLRVIIPFSLKLPSGQMLSAEALLPELGFSNGMIVSQSSDDFHNYGKELEKLGYGMSVYDEPLPSEEFDLASYVEMFSDWGWGNTNERKPDWMK